MMKEKKALENFLNFVIKNSEKFQQNYFRKKFFSFLAGIFKIIFESSNEIGISLLFCVSLPGYTWNCGSKSKDTIINLQSLQDNSMILLLDFKIRGGISSVMGDRYARPD